MHPFTLLLLSSLPQCYTYSCFPITHPFIHTPTHSSTLSLARSPHLSSHKYRKFRTHSHLSVFPLSLMRPIATNSFRHASHIKMKLTLQRCKLMHVSTHCIYIQTFLFISVVSFFLPCPHIPSSSLSYALFIYLT